MKSRVTQAHAEEEYIVYSLPLQEPGNEATSRRV